MPTFKISKEEQKKVNKYKLDPNIPLGSVANRGLGGLNFESYDTKSERTKRGVAAGLKEPWLGHLSKEEVAIAESHKRAIERTEDYKQYLHEKKAGGARTESYKDWKGLD